MADTYKPGWYAVALSNGTIGFVQHDHDGPIKLGRAGQPSSAQLLNSNVKLTLGQLMSVSGVGATANTFFTSVGATAKQQATTTQIVDVGAGKYASLHQVLISVTGAVNARTAAGKSISDKSTGDATQTSLIPGIGVPDISGVTDFLKWVSWLFNPLNWLRLAEFSVGMIFLLFGLYLQFARRPLSGTGAGVARVSRELGAATPIGRASNYRQGRRQGRREGQIEQGRLEGRISGRTEADRSKVTSNP